MRFERHSGTQSSPAFGAGRSVAAWCALFAGGMAFAQTTPAAAKVDTVRAEQAYLAGIRLVDKNDYAGAQAEFARAAGLDGTRAEYTTAMVLTRDHRVGDLMQRAAKERMTNHELRADGLVAEAAALDPTHPLVLQRVSPVAANEPLRPRMVMTPAKNYAGSIELKPTAGLQDLHLRGDVRQVVTRAALNYGVRVVFDDSVNGQGPTGTAQGDIRFDLEQTPYTEAMPVLLRMTHLLTVPIDAHSILVARDTEENHQKFERQMEETIYIPASTTEQYNDLVNIVKNVFDVKQIGVSPGNGTMAIRASAPTLQALNYTLADMLDGGAEVMLEIKLIAVDKTLSRQIGSNLPTTASAFSLAAELQTFVSANQGTVQALISSGALTLTGTSQQQLVEQAVALILAGIPNAKLTNILTFFGHGLTLFGLSVSGGANFNLALNSSESHALEDISVRVGDRQTSTLRVGEKYPITTATYSSGISSATSAALAGVTVNGVNVQKLLNQYTGAASSVPQVQFEDLGLTLKTTPYVERSNLVRVNIDLKLEALTGASLNDIPILTSRAFNSDITVADGDTVVMLSDTSKMEAASISGLPGLAELPGFDTTLSDKLREVQSSELMLLVTPHLVRRRANSVASRRIPFRTSAPIDY